LTSAPVLSLAVIGFAAAAWGVEHQMRVNNESLMAFALSSDDGREFEAGLSSDLSETVTAALTQRVLSTPAGDFEAASLQADALFQTAPQERRRAMVAFTGRLLSSRNRFEEALAALSVLSEAERNRFNASFAYAETLKGLGDDAAALAAFERHVAAHPNHQAGHINYAILLMRLGRHAEALPILDRAVEITSGGRKGKSLSLRGISLMELGDFTGAEAAFQQSIEYRPGHAPTWGRLATAQARGGAFSQADVIATFERAIALAPGDGLIESGLAQYYFSAGRFDEALGPYRSASRNAQHRGEVMIDRALNLVLSERPSAARNVVRTLKAANTTRAQDRQIDLLDDILNRSTSAVLRHLQAHADARQMTERGVFLQILGHLEVGDIAMAQRYAADLPASSSYHQPAHFQIARHHYRAARADAARSILSELVASNDQSPIFWLYLGRSEPTPEAALIAHRTAHELLPTSGRMAIEYAEALNAAGRTADATATLFAFLDAQPNEPRALRALARIHDANQQLDRAEQIYRVILDLNAEDAGVGRALADIQIRAGRLEAALETLDRLIELQPARIDIREQRADILMTLGRSADARAEFERIHRLDPDNATANASLNALAGSSPAGRMSFSRQVQP